jgi:hypothetical protein
VTAVRSQAISSWRAVTLPYPEPGLRLIRQDRIERFDQQMNELKNELAEAVVELDRRYGELRVAARDRLGRLYNATDYPAQLVGLFQLEWDFPSVEPPEYLLRLKRDPDGGAGVRQ